MIIHAYDGPDIFSKIKKNLSAGDRLFKIMSENDLLVVGGKVLNPHLP